MADNNSDYTYETPEFDYEAYYNYASDIAEKTHQYDMEMAEWNASEAQKARDWETQMSNTSYQRAVADLKAAGLNPVLASKVTGASTPSAVSSSGSSSAGNSLSSAFGQILNSAVSASNKLADLAIASMNNQTSKENTLINASTSQSIAKLQSDTSIYGYDVTKRGQDLNYALGLMSEQTKKELSQAQIESDEKIAKNSHDVQRYVSDQSYKANIYNTDQQKLRQDSEHQFEAWMKAEHPQSWAAIANEISRVEGARLAESKKAFDEMLSKFCNKFANSSYDEANAKSEVDAFSLFKNIVNSEIGTWIKELKQGKIPTALYGIW